MCRIAGYPRKEVGRNLKGVETARLLTTVRAIPPRNSTVFLSLYYVAGGEINRMYLL